MSLKFNKVFVATLLLASSAFTFANANTEEKITYSYVGIWTGGNKYSSAPQPACACDINPNNQDCPLREVFMRDVGDVCYDEFIPDGSIGYVHAGIYEVVSDQ